jgi:AbrB family looped-hinge helix DNA binding protein
MTVHTVSEKGWVVIPADLRKKYGLQPGAEVRIVDYGGVLAIIPAMENPVKNAAGMLKTEKHLTQYLLEEHRRER